MIPIHVNQDFLPAEGYSAYEIDSERNLDLSFRFEKDCDIFIRLVRAKNVRIRMFVNEGVRAGVLIWNNSDDKTVMDESYEVMKDADLVVAYGECNSGETKRNTYVALRGSNARALVSSASLVSVRKDYHIDVVNFAPHTFGDMKNYAVVLKDGTLVIDAVGKIVKGAKRSESHQTSRALCFEDGQKSTILPELLIDENDVQASHAMSIGRMDEDQLYYMMSRGLTLAQCTSLIATGYLMPITDTLPNEELRASLKQEMERKITELCSM